MVTKTIKKTETVKKPAKKVVKKVSAVKPVKKTVKAVKIEKPEIIEEGKVSGEYIEAVGRRKTSIARVRIYAKGDKKVVVNGKTLAAYFPSSMMQKKIMDPLEKMNVLDKFGVTVLVKGGGLNSQSEAIRHGISRTLVKFNADFRKRLKRAGFLTRDSRERERKKFGLKRARRAPQWSKR
jgi:small subunit ribosomal protein S9